MSFFILAETANILHSIKHLPRLLRSLSVKNVIICALAENSPQDCFFNARLRISPSLFGLLNIKKTPILDVFFYTGGDGEIRTRGGLLPN